MVNVSEGQRRQRHAGLVETIGADVADTLMDYLPHAGWSDLARRSDIDMLRLGMQAMEARLDSKFTDKLNSLMRWFVGTQLVLVVAVIGSITTIAH
jgi:hypothetical protein